MIAIRKQPSGRTAFTLIEMIGVLAIVATLVAMLLPRLFGVISQARVMETVSSYTAVRSAAVTYAAKYGVIGDTSGAAFNLSTNPPAATDWDKNVLFKLGLLDQSFRCRIAEQAVVQVRAPLGVDSDPDGTNSAYHLAILSPVVNHTAGRGAIVDVRLVNVPRDDALELNRLIDGSAANLSESSAGVDLEGRVKYDYSAVGVTGLADVYLYLTHL